MRTLDNHNDMMLDAQRRADGEPPATDVACNHCGTEMLYSDHLILTTIPPQRRVECPDCGNSGLKILYVAVSY
ncbi:MAG: hypothetical protein F4Z29_07510 [Gemmatimonadetes bacterium]|nr:hypothetical protein [Gemmatimonadota bacterium]